MRKVIYMAHPVAPSDGEITECIRRLRGFVGGSPGTTEVSEISKEIINANITRALAWLAWLRKSFPETTFIAPWIAAIQSGEDDLDPKAREAGLVDACAVIERCDGIVLCGVRVSSGMARERDHGMMRFKIWMDPADPDREYFPAYDLTCPTNPDPPLTVGPLWTTLEELAETARLFWSKA